MRKIIFVGGIHGVGKTSFCKEISKHFNLHHFSASELISKYINIDFPKNKKANNISNNQNVLIEALDKYTDKNSKILLDGHFCLLDQNGVVTKIPEGTFSSLSPQAIIVLSDSSRNITSRLSSRDNSSFDINNITAFQDRELEYSQEIASKLNIPYLIHRINLNQNYIDFFNKILK